MSRRSRQKEREYIPFPIENFITALKAPVDLYVKLGDDKFVLLVKRGTKTDSSQLMNYQNKRIDYLWVPKDQFATMSKHNVIIAGIAVEKKQLNATHKMYFVSAAAHLVFNELEHLGFTQEGFQRAKEVTEATVALTEQNSNLYKLIESLNTLSDALVKHSLAVSALSVLIGQRMGWTNKLTMEKLALGGMLHDIGLKALPEDLLLKPLSEMSSEEIKIYETHPYKGMEMALSLGVVPDDVVSIIYEHQENAIGQGYPRRIRDVKMHPLARVVALADAFVKLVIPNVNHPQPKSPREAILYIEQTMGLPFNKEAFSALKEIISDPQMHKIA